MHDVFNQRSHYINGEWVLGEGTPLLSYNPADNALIWQGRMALPTELSMAISAAHQAKGNWSSLTFQQRCQYVTQFAAQVEKRRTQLTHAIALETGKPLWEAATEVTAVIAKVSLSIKAHQQRLAEHQEPEGNGFGLIRYKPHGVVLVLGPFNFPAHLSNGHIIPALLAGNTIIYKPSELTPGVATIIMSCWHEASLPKGVLNCVQGDAASAQFLLKQPLQGVFFTGSYQAGLAIHQHFIDKPEMMLALEMGGNNPLLIDTVDNTKAALYHTLLSTLITSGQRCSCARRLLIPNNKAGDAFIDQFLLACQRIKIGSFTSQPEPFMGPVISYTHAKKHLHAQDKLLDLGGKPLLKMRLLKEKTAFLSPGVLDMSSIKQVPDEELFAPFIQLFRYDDLQHGIALANQTSYGLSAGIFTDNPKHYEQFYQQVNAGLIHWNRPTTGALSSLPFGGIGHSGNHRPSAFFAADYCAYPIASLIEPSLALPKNTLPGIDLND